MSDAKVDLNQADAAELTGLPGIGQKLAEKIFDYRREHQFFTEAADLAAVPGISEQMVGELEEHLIVRPPDVQTAPDPEQPADKTSEKKNKTVNKPPVAGGAYPPKQKPDGAERKLQALRTTARTGDANGVAKLINDGADGRDKFALLWAAQEGHNQIVVELIEAGADPNSKSAAGGPNALALAAQNGHLEVVQTLVDAGADVNEAAMQGWTPLMKAAFFGHDRIVQCLLEAGAEILIRDMRGRTAVDHAQRADSRMAVSLLVR